MVRSPSFMRSALACALLVPFALGCADTSPPGDFAARPDAAAPAPDAEPALWWDSGVDAPDAAVMQEAESLHAPPFGHPVRTRLVSFETPPRWLGGALTGSGALLVWDAGDSGRHDLVALPLGRDGKARGAPRPVLAGPGAVTSATLVWDWRRDILLLVADTPAGALAMRLEPSGAPLGPVTRLEGPGEAALPVSSAAIRTREGFLLAHASGADTVALTTLPADAGASAPPPHRIHLPGARRLQLADTGEARYLAFDGPTAAGLRRLDTDATTLPWSPGARTDLLADGEGLLAVVCLGDTPGEPGALVAERLDATGRPRSAPRLLAKSTVPCDFSAHLRPTGGLALRHGRHLTRFDTGFRPDGESGHLPSGSLPPVVLWAREAGLACGVFKDALGETLDCLALAP